MTRKVKPGRWISLDCENFSPHPWAISEGKWLSFGQDIYGTVARTDRVWQKSANSHKIIMRYLQNGL